MTSRARFARRMPALFASSLAGLTALALITALSPAACTLSRSGIPNDQGGSGGVGNSSQGGSSSQGGTTSTMTSSGGMGGSGGGNTTSGAGGCMSAVEDCLNGVDDDCDGDIDCGDSDCTNNNSYECVPLPLNGTLVDPVDGPGDCAGELTVATLADCSQCGCSVNDPGSCTHIAYLFTEPNCIGTPFQMPQIMPGAACTPANTQAGNGQTVSGRAESVGLDNASCVPDSTSASTTTRYLCTLPNPGSCMGNDVCVPTDAVPCVMFNGDVSCPAGFDEKEIIYDTTSNSCNCDCTVVDQTCPTGEHYHAFSNAGCNGTKVDMQDNGTCTNSTFAAFLSLDNHTAEINADDATCEPTGGPTMAQDARTLCCPPD